MNSTIERLLSLRVADVMRREVITLSPDDTMAAAAARMLELGVSGAPVVNSAQKLIGMLSNTDFVRKIAEHDAQTGCVGKEWVEDQMTRTLVSICVDHPMLDAAREMCAQHVHRLPVVDRAGKLVGLVSSLAGGASRRRRGVSATVALALVVLDQRPPELPVTVEGGCEEYYSQLRAIAESFKQTNTSP